MVVYESMYGNTHEVANSIAAGLRAEHEVDVVSVEEASPALVMAADLLVVGGPTHVHGMTSARSRVAAVEALAKDDTLELDEHAPGPGLRNWLDELQSRAVAAAFDTRIDASPILTGRASKGIDKRLKAAGCKSAVSPESFLVDKHNRLVRGETDRARAWARRLAVRARTARAPSGLAR